MTEFDSVLCYSFLFGIIGYRKSWVRPKLAGKGWTVMRASAKVGENVDAAFRKLTEKMLGA